MRHVHHLHHHRLVPWIVVRVVACRCHDHSSPGDEALDHHVQARAQQLNLVHHPREITDVAAAVISVP